MTINVLEYLENSERRFPNKVAFADDTNTIDYFHLKEYGQRIGTYVLNTTKNPQRQPIVVFVDRNIEILS